MLNTVAPDMSHCLKFLRVMYMVILYVVSRAETGGENSFEQNLCFSLPNQINLKKWQNKICRLNWNSDSFSNIPVAKKMAFSIGKIRALKVF